MKLPKLPRPLRGIVTPIVTPLLDDDQLDLDGLACLLDHIIDGGVAGIFALGSGAFDLLRWILVTFGLCMAHATNNLLCWPLRLMCKSLCWKILPRSTCMNNWPRLIISSLSAAARLMPICSRLRRVCA